MSLTIKYAGHNSYTGGTPDFLVEIVPDGYVHIGRHRRPAYRAQIKTRTGKRVVAEQRQLTLAAARKWCKQQAVEA